MDKIISKIRILKGDTVIVRAGKYKGKTGKVVATHPADNKVTVEGVNLFKKHVKPNKAYPQGGIIEMTRPIDVSKVGYYDTVSKSASRIGYSIDKDGKKVRVLKKTGKAIVVAKAVVASKGKK